MLTIRTSNDDSQVELIGGEEEIKDSKINDIDNESIESVNDDDDDDDSSEFYYEDEDDEEDEEVVCISTTAVQFDLNHNEIYHIESISEYTDEEIQICWYSVEETDQLKDLDRAMAKQIRSEQQEQEQQQEQNNDSLSSSSSSSPSTSAKNAPQPQHGPSASSSSSSSSNGTMIQKDDQKMEEKEEYCFRGIETKIHKHLSVQQQRIQSMAIAAVLNEQDKQWYHEIHDGIPCDDSAIAKAYQRFSTICHLSAAHQGLKDARDACYSTTSRW